MAQSRSASAGVAAAEVPCAEWSWLQRRLLELPTQERQLVEGHVCHGLGWAELGRELGLHPRQVQRRTLALLRRLQAEARQWQRDGQPHSAKVADG